MLRVFYFLACWGFFYVVWSPSAEGAAGSRGVESWSARFCVQAVEVIGRARTLGVPEPITQIVGWTPLKLSHWFASRSISKGEVPSHLFHPDGRAKIPLFEGFLGAMAAKSKLKETIARLEGIFGQDFWKKVADQLEKEEGVVGGVFLDVYRHLRDESVSEEQKASYSSIYKRILLKAESVPIQDAISMLEALYQHAYSFGFERLWWSSFVVSEIDRRVQNGESVFLPHLELEDYYKVDFVNADLSTATILSLFKRLESLKRELERARDLKAQGYTHAKIDMTVIRQDFAFNQRCHDSLECGALAGIGVADPFREDFNVWLDEVYPEIHGLLLQDLIERVRGAALVENRLWLRVWLTIFVRVSGMLTLTSPPDELRASAEKALLEAVPEKAELLKRLLKKIDAEEQAFLDVFPSNF
ncbi:MAG: hypothetical protein EA369_09605 [Bradymonadales bacterium]|nr:MAG: hypothetical protein EA369_09605 [Bradymonadales bacterium]